MSVIADVLAVWVVGIPCIAVACGLLKARRRDLHGARLPAPVISIADARLWRATETADARQKAHLRA